MTAIPGISAIGSLPATTQIGPTEATQATAPTGIGQAAGAGSGGSFGDVLSTALGSVEGAQNNADGLAVQAATGNLTNVQDYMVAAEQANIDTQLTVAVRNNAVQAFQQIMSMPL